MVDRRIDSQTQRHMRKANNSGLQKEKVELTERERQRETERQR